MLSPYTCSSPVHMSQQCNSSCMLAAGQPGTFERMHAMLARGSCAFAEYFQMPFPGILSFSAR